MTISHKLMSLTGGVSCQDPVGILPGYDTRVKLFLLKTCFLSSFLAEVLAAGLGSS